MRDAIDQYYADKNQYPATIDALVSEGYLRKIPEDPFTKSASSWQTVPAEPDPNNPSAEVGIYDIKSGVRTDRPRRPPIFRVVILGQDRNVRSHFGIDRSMAPRCFPIAIQRNADGCCGVDERRAW